MPSAPRRRRAARHLQLDGAQEGARRGPSDGQKRPITVAAIVDTAFGIVATEGYEALTMRGVAAALETGPASLYAHVVNKDDLDELLISRLFAQVELPAPDGADWQEQIMSICTQMRDRYLRYPGISRAALAMASTNLETMRIFEGMLAIMLAGGVDSSTAAWAIDSLTLYVNAYCLEVSLRERRAAADDWAPDRDELLRRFADLPDTFPMTKRHAAEITAGSGHDRFDFTVELILDGAQRHARG